MLGDGFLYGRSGEQQDQEAGVSKSVACHLDGMSDTKNRWQEGGTHDAIEADGKSVSQAESQPEAAARAAALLARSVQNQAYVLAYIDGFMVLGFAVISALLLMLLLRDLPANIEQTAARK